MTQVILKKNKTKKKTSKRWRDMKAENHQMSVSTFPPQLSVCHSEL